MNKKSSAASWRGSKDLGRQLLHRKLTSRMRFAVSWLKGDKAAICEAAQTVERYAGRWGVNELNRPDDWHLLAEYVHLAKKDVPETVSDKPAAARRRGYKVVEREAVFRQDEITDPKAKRKFFVECGDTEVFFTDDVQRRARYVVIDAGKLQPSHREGKRNWLHFIPEAQPKNRTDTVSAVTADKHARDIKPELLLGNSSAYSGAPVVNSRGEVIQGNGRADALRIMWERYPNSAEKYAHAVAEFVGKKLKELKEEVLPFWRGEFGQPVLVRMLDVDDEEAITLGQYSDTQMTSGGGGVFSPRAVARQLVSNKEFSKFTRIIFDVPDGDESSLKDLIRGENGMQAVAWLARMRYITPSEAQACIEVTRYGKAMTKAGREAMLDVFASILFEEAQGEFEAMFDKIPARAQTAIVGIAARDVQMPDGKKLLPDIRRGVELCAMLTMRQPDFEKARTADQARHAIYMWENQSTMFNADKFPADQFSAEDKALAVLFKVGTMRGITQTLSEIYGKMEGSAPSMFANDEFAELSKMEAMRRVLGTGSGLGLAQSERVAEMESCARRFRHDHKAPRGKEDDAMDIFFRLAMPMLKEYPSARGNDPDFIINALADFFCACGMPNKVYEDNKAREIMYIAETVLYYAKQYAEKRQKQQ